MIVQYDPVGLDDSFGRVMIRNLQVGPVVHPPAVAVCNRAEWHIPMWQTRGLKLLGLPASTSLPGQVERLKRLGFDAAHAQDIKTIRKMILPAAEQERCVHHAGLQQSCTAPD
jgi:hypothetical protein